MNYPEIMNLRKSGTHLAAYEEAKKLLEQYPGDMWALRAMEWCIYDFAKETANHEQREDCLARLLELKNLGLPENETLVVNNLSWVVMALIRDCVKHQCCTQDLLNRLFSTLQCFHWQKPSKEYSILMKAFSNVRNDWNGFVEFCDWWGWNSFMPEDYVPEEFNGKSKPISLVEQTYIACSKMLLGQYGMKIVGADEIRSFIDKLSAIIAAHPEYQYPLYYKAKLQVCIGDRAAAVETLKPFAMRKQNDFWVWELLGDASDNEEMRFSCYCKGLLCKAPDEMIVSLRFNMAQELVKRGLYNFAKTEVLRVMQTYRTKQWRSKPAVDNMAHEAWWMTCLPATDKELQAFYQDNKEMAEEFLFADMPEIPILITKLNEEKEMANAIIHLNGTKEVFFKYSRIRMFRKSKPQVHSVYLVRTEGLVAGKPLKVLTIRPDDGANKAEFVKSSIGNIHIKPGNNFGFVGSIYVPGILCNQLSDGMPVQVEAIETFNKNKGEWSWKAISVNN